MKIVTIIGARPQFIKAAPLSNYILAHHPGIREILIHTGQHYDDNMSRVFFDEMGIPKPDYLLSLGGGGHGRMTGRMLEQIEKILLKEKPDWVLVYGDTNSTLAGALAASKLHIRIAHVEAGLRSYNMRMPEEVNRILTDRISSVLFCPSQDAVDNLAREGSAEWNTRVVIAGDIMKDAVDFYSPRGQPVEGITVADNFVLATVHRAENTDDEARLKGVFNAMRTIAATNKVVLPLHPRTAKMLEQFRISTDGITIVPPVGYLNMVYLLANCQMVLTDSGGLQKEAYYFGKPCITLRDETEWVELVTGNYNVLTGADEEKILSAWSDHVFSDDFSAAIYGGGDAREVIVEALVMK